jgi:hypothetical protein
MASSLKKKGRASRRPALSGSGRRSYATAERIFARLNFRENDND